MPHGPQRARGLWYWATEGEGFAVLGAAEPPLFFAGEAFDERYSGYMQACPSLCIGIADGMCTVRLYAALRLKNKNDVVAASNRNTMSIRMSTRMSIRVPTPHRFQHMSVSSMCATPRRVTGVDPRAMTI